MTTDRRFQIRLAASDEIVVAHAVQMASFAETAYEPHPSSALFETAADLRREALLGGIVLGTYDDRFVASGRFTITDAHLAFERLAVLPAVRGRGLGRALVRWFESHARRLGLHEVRCSARSRYPDNREFYRRLNYEVIGYSDRYGVTHLRTHFRRHLR